MTLDRERVVRALPGYDVGDELGRGGWALVLAATHRNLQRPVAVKVLPRAFGADPEVRARFHDEARVVASLHHPHIVPVYDFVEHEGLHLVVMERMTTETLWDRFTDEGVTLEQAFAFALATGSALTHAHQRGVVHRDVKPENLLFTTDPQPVLQLADFGIAKVLGQGAPALTVTGMVLGTPAYLAPEQVRGEPVSTASDVYAVGVMLYELACGTVPFADVADPLAQLDAKVAHPAPPLRDRRPDIHPAVDELLTRVLDRDPRARPASADDLTRSIAHVGTQAFGPGWLRRSMVPVHASLDVVALTEHPAASPHPAMADLRVTRALGRHERVGDVDPETIVPVEAPPTTPPPTAAPPTAAPPTTPPPTAAPPTTAPPTTAPPTTAPPPGSPSPPPSAGAPPAGSIRRRRPLVLVVAALVVLLVVAVAAGALARRRSGGAPVLEPLQATAAAATITWRDDGDGGDHLLIAWSTDGHIDQTLTSSPQVVEFVAGTQYCFQVARAADRAVRSEARCVNGGDAGRLVTG